MRQEKNFCPSCKIYYGICGCGEDYPGETERNTKIRWSEHNNLKYNSEPVNILKNVDHIITWKPSTKEGIHQEKFRAIFIAQLKPLLNEKKEFDYLSF